MQCTSRYHRHLLDTGGTRGGTILHAADSVAAAVNNPFSQYSVCNPIEYGLAYFTTCSFWLARHSSIALTVHRSVILTVVIAAVIAK